MSDKIFIYEHGGITSAAVIGNANSLKEGLEKYKLRGLFRKNAEFFPAIAEGAGRYSLRGYVSSPNPYLIDAVQIQKATPNTGINCIGISRQVIDFTKDLASTLELEADEPTERLKGEISLLHKSIEELWRISSMLGPTKRRGLLIQAMKEYCRMPAQISSILN